MPSATVQQEPWREDWPTDLTDPLEEDIALQKRIIDSEFWRLFKRALQETRERILETPAVTTEMLQRRDGAIGQLTYLLHHAPVLVVWQARKDREHDGR